MFETARVATRLPTQDLDRARRFYSEKLGLEPTEQRRGGLLYRFGNGEFVLYRSAGNAPGTFTQMALEVDDLDAVVVELRRRGVVFEEVDLPGLRTTGHRRSRGQLPEQGWQRERAAWFRDSEGNLLGMGQPLRPDVDASGVSAPGADPRSRRRAAGRATAVRATPIAATADLGCRNEEKCPHPQQCHGVGAICLEYRGG